MSDDFSLRLSLQSPEHTNAFAKLLAPLLRAGDVILLSGNVGAGKTHFARALIQARLSVAGIYEDIPSPTYTLVQAYNDGICDIWHTDLYRLNSTTEVIELGLEEAFNDAICLVEWPDRLQELRPEDALEITLTLGKSDTVRIAEIAGSRHRWPALISLLESSEYDLVAEHINV